MLQYFQQFIRHNQQSAPTCRLVLLVSREVMNSVISFDKIEIKVLYQKQTFNNRPNKITDKYLQLPYLLDFVSKLKICKRKAHKVFTNHGINQRINQTNFVKSRRAQV